MNYYPFHIGDYLSATRHLSWEEDAAYRRLLDTYYTTEKPIPADLRAACRLVTAQTESQREAVRVVLAEFFTLTEVGWLNKRADLEIAAMRKFQEKQRANAYKRWGTPQHSDAGNSVASKLDAVASHPHTTALPPTPTPNSEAIASDGADAPASFPPENPDASPLPQRLQAPLACETPDPPASSIDGKAALWREGLAVLQAGGCKSENMARSFMGKLVKDYGSEVVREAVTAAIVAQPIDAREYLTAACKRMKGERREPITVPSDAAEKTAAYLRAQAERGGTRPPPEILAMRRKPSMETPGPEREAAGVGP